MSGNMTLQDLLLRLNDGGAAALARVWVDWSLDRRASEVLDIERISDLIVAALQAGAASPRLEAWAADALKAARTNVPSGKARPRVPAELLPPVVALLGVPVVPNKTLVRRLLRHEALEELLRETLTDALTGFARKLRPTGMNPNVAAAASRGFGLLRGMARETSENLLGGLSHEIERQAESRVRDFVDGAISAAMDELADDLCRPENAPRFAAWRVYAADTLLDTELSTLAQELDKLGPERVAAAAAAILSGLAARDSLREELRAALAAARSGLGDRTLRSLLEESGVGEAGWREPMEALLISQMQAFLASEVFSGWAGEWLLDRDTKN